MCVLNAGHSVGVDTIIHHINLIYSFDYRKSVGQLKVEGYGDIKRSHPNCRLATLGDYKA